MIRIFKKRKNLNLVLGILFFSHSALASEYCFNNTRPIHSIRYELKTFLVKGETAVINSRQNCISVNTRPERTVFISKLIHSNFSKLMVSSTDVPYRKELCKLKLKELTTVKDKTSEDISELVSTEGNTFELDLGGQLISFVCKKYAGKLVLDLGKKSEQKLTSLSLKMGTWVDLSTFSTLDGKTFSLMAVE